MRLVCPKIIIMTHVTIGLLVFYISDSGIDAIVDMRQSMCLNRAVPGYEKVPVNGCAKNSDAYDWVEWGKYLKTNFKDVSGETCTCSEPACNYLGGKARTVADKRGGGKSPLKIHNIDI